MIYLFSIVGELEVDSEEEARSILERCVEEMQDNNNKIDVELDYLEEV